MCGGKKCLLMVAIGLTIAALGLCVTGTATSHWLSYRVSWKEADASHGLWIKCITENPGKFCMRINHAAGAVLFNRFATILSNILMLFAVIPPILDCCNKLKSKVPIYVAAAALIGSGVMLFMSTMWYVGEELTISDIDNLRFGYSIMLIWLAIPMAVISGILIILATRRTKAPPPV